MLEMKMMNLLIGALIVPLIGIAVLTFSLAVMHGSYILAVLLVGITVVIAVLSAKLGSLIGL